MNDPDLARVTEILSTLIALPTVNPMERPYQHHEPVERPVTKYLQTLFAESRADISVEACSEIHENLLITIRGEADDSATLLESHVDTVPAEDWTNRAFSPHIRDGYLYGRGACDDKGSLAAMIFAVIQLLESGVKPPQTVFLLAAGDEECGQTGIRHFADNTTSSLGRGVFGEPTSCLPIVQHKGCIRWDITVAGESSHSSQPEKGRNAIYDMLQVVACLRDLQRAWKEDHDSTFITAPTLTVTMIQGGETRNALPAGCRCAVDLRVVPGTDPKRVCQQVVSRVDALGLATEHGPFQCFVPPLCTPPNHDFPRQVLQFCKDELCGEVEMASAPYGSDASWMPQAAPAVVLGPGSIDHAHAIDERVELNQVLRCSQIYRRIITHDWSTA